MRRPRSSRSERRRQIAGYLRQVAFSQTAVGLCEQEATSAQEEFLHRVLVCEMAHREEVRKARYLREAAFPVYKTFAGYEFEHLKLPTQFHLSELQQGQFIRERKNLLCYGPVGTGKTHLAIAVGVAACEAGIRTRFFTAAELVVRLSEAYHSGTLEKVMKALLKAELLIIDEWGYVPIDKQGAQLLFRIVSDSYERRSLIITTNLEFSRWGSIFTDDQMAAAMIDRLAHYGYILVFEGESYRMRHALMRQKQGSRIPTS
jgi:DNA replication protein DnaC